MNEKEYNSMKTFYPCTVRKLSYLVEDMCDQLEYEDSVMFREFPDAVTIDRIVVCICKKQGDDSLETKNLVKVLLLHEIFYRRNRYHKHHINMKV